MTKQALHLEVHEILTHLNQKLSRETFKPLNREVLKRRFSHFEAVISDLLRGGELFPDATGLLIKTSKLKEVNSEKLTERILQHAMPEAEVGEQVNHPTHYGGAGNTYEAIKVIEAWGLDFCLGNTVKYIARAGKKDELLQELKKARWYLDRKIQQLSGEGCQGNCGLNYCDTNGCTERKRELVDSAIIIQNVKAV